MFTLPKPVPADRSDLPAAFRKRAPTSTNDLKAMEQWVKALASRISPAVVAVSVGNDSGSGVIVSEDGLVLTAGHVCGAPNRDARFTLPSGRTVRGKTLGADLGSDTGLMRITDTGSWPCACVGDLDGASVGDWVLALGHPGGFDSRRSLVMRLGRIIRLGEDSLQTDCTISPGDSGGPLFDMFGRVIGIHNAISGSTSENFHVTITEYAWTWDQLTRGAFAPTTPPPRAYAGASSTDTSKGCELTVIEPGSPASRAGLRAGDVIVRVEGRNINVSASFRRWIDEAQPGDELALDIRRGDQELRATVRLENLPHRE